MSDNQSKTPEQDSNGTVENSSAGQEPSYTDIMAALEAGDSSALDRLMAVEKDEDEDDNGNTEGNKEGEESEGKKTQGSQEDDDSNKEPVEAANAASTAQDATHNQPDPNEELRRELHRLRSDVGRVAGLQRKVQELERELRTARARTHERDDSQQGSSTQPAQPKLPDNIRNRIEQLRAVDPELADTLQEMYAASAQRDDHTREDVLRQVEERREQEEMQRHFAEQKALLSEWVPEHEQIFASPQWADWKETLLPGQRAMAESGYALEVAQAIQAFAHWLRASQGNHAQSNASSKGGDPNGNNTNMNASNGGNPNPVVEQRQRKIEASAGVKHTPAKAHEEFDAEQYFSQVYNDLGKKNGVLK